MTAVNDQFDQYHSVAGFTDAEAAAFVVSHGIAVSAMLKRGGPPNALYLALATNKGQRLGPFVISPRAAAEIRKVLVDQGF